MQEEQIIRKVAFNDWDRQYIAKQPTSAYDTRHHDFLPGLSSFIVAILLSVMTYFLFVASAVSLMVSLFIPRHLDQKLRHFWQQK